MYRMYSTGHPHIPAGEGETRELAILNFVKNADSAGVGVRKIFELTLKSPIEGFLRNHTAEETFVILERSGNYGDLFLESEKEATFRNEIKEVIHGLEFHSLSKALVKGGIKHAIFRGTKDIYIPCEEASFYKRVKFFVIRENGDTSGEYLEIDTDNLLWVK
jgi:hypothetical protein